jgi:glycine/sarcosine N-methyltransferase
MDSSHFLRRIGQRSISRVTERVVSDVRLRRQSGIESLLVECRMGATVQDFYDDLSSDYHLIFEDWEASMASQAAALRPILVRECGTTMPIRVLDCACGIGTQALGLARAGFRVTGTDLSPRAIERADMEASTRSLDLQFQVADMLHLDVVAETEFDAVICMDNALPHLSCDEKLAAAAAQIRKKLRPGGIFVASTRDYDRLIQERPVVDGPRFFSDAGRRRIVFQLWDWIDERRYSFHLYVTRETPTGWRTQHGTTTYRAVLREELATILESVGFVRVKWALPAETGFFQPLVVGVAG